MPDWQRRQNEASAHEAIARLNEANRRMAELRARYGVKPGESLWQAMFGEPFPLAEVES